MRQKDFTFIARIISELPGGKQGHVAHLFANRLAAEFPHFRSSTFLSECGITTAVRVVYHNSPETDNKRWGWSYDDGQAD
jgi:hypothetical protein